MHWFCRKQTRSLSLRQQHQLRHWMPNGCRLHVAPQMLLFWLWYRLRGTSATLRNGHSIERSWVHYRPSRWYLWVDVRSSEGLSGWCWWFTDYPPRLEVETYEPEVTGLLGDQAILNCAVSGNPNPKIVWSKNNLIVSNRKASWFGSFQQQFGCFIRLMAPNQGTASVWTRLFRSSPFIKQTQAFISARPITVSEPPSRTKSICWYQVCVDPVTNKLTVLVVVCSLF